MELEKEDWEKIKLHAKTQIKDALINLEIGNQMYNLAGDQIKEFADLKEESIKQDVVEDEENDMDD